MTSWTKLAVVLAIVAGLVALGGCGPSTPSIQTVVQQVVQAQTASILQQVDWKQVMTALKGSVGPESVIEVEGYIKQSAGMIIRIHGGQMSFETQASGTGGRDNSEFMQAIMPVLQRWEQQDNLSTEQRRQLSAEITAALIRYFDAKATKAAATAPTQ